MALYDYDVLSEAGSIVQRQDLVQAILETPALRAEFAKLVQDLAPLIREIAEWAHKHPELLSRENSSHGPA